MRCLMLILPEERQDEDHYCCDKDPKAQPEEEAEEEVGVGVGEPDQMAPPVA